MPEHSTCHDSDARDLAEKAWSGSAEAIKTTAVVQGQFKTIIVLLAAIGATILGVFGWIVARVESQGNEARKVAEMVAIQELQKADRRLDARMAQVAQDAAREAVRLRDEQVDRIVLRK